MIWASFLPLLPFVVVVSALPQAPEDPDADDYVCHTSFLEYDTSSNAAESWTKTTLYTNVYEDIITYSDVPLTTLCDRRPRALESYRFSTTITTTTFDPPETRDVFVSYTGPSPTCTIAETACTPISSAWDSSYTDFLSSSSPYPIWRPHCTTFEPEPTPEPEPSRISCDANPGYCRLYGPIGVKVYYWPVTTINGDLCAQNGTTITPTPTDPNGAPNTAIADGVTFTSPTNYFSIDRAEAMVHFRRPNRSPCGPPARTNVLVPLTGEFSSTRNYEVGGGEASFNFADLQTPVPAAAWDGQRRCNYYAQTGACPTIVGHYVPQVMMPTQVVNLEPEWQANDCTGLATPHQVRTYVNLENGQTTGMPSDSQITDPPEVNLNVLSEDKDWPA